MRKGRRPWLGANFFSLVRARIVNHWLEIIDDIDKTGLIHIHHINFSCRTIITNQTNQIRKLSAEIDCPYCLFFFKNQHTSPDCRMYLFDDGTFVSKRCGRKGDFVDLVWHLVSGVNSGGELVRYLRELVVPKPRSEKLTRFDLPKRLGVWLKPKKPPKEPPK